MNSVEQSRLGTTITKWKRKAQECEEHDDYFFNGVALVTSNIKNELERWEIHQILNDMYGFLKTRPQGIDYLQIYEHPDREDKIYIIDQLSKEMIESGDFEPEHNHFTVLFSWEY